MATLTCSIFWCVGNGSDGYFHCAITKLKCHVSFRTGWAKTFPTLAETLPKLVALTFNSIIFIKRLFTLLIFVFVKDVFHIFFENSFWLLFFFFKSKYYRISPCRVFVSELQKHGEELKFHSFSTFKVTKMCGFSFISKIHLFTSTFFSPINFS